MGDKSRKDIFEKMIRFSPDMHCAIDENGRIITASDACKQLLGYEPEELEGKAYLNMVCPDDSSRTEGFLFSIRNSQVAHYFENRCLHKNGNLLPLSWSVNWSAEDNLFFFTARKATEASAHNTKESVEAELYKQLILHGGDMSALVDEAGTYLYVEGATTRNLGYEPAKLIGTNVFCLIHPEDLYKIKAAWVELIKTKITQRTDFRFKASNGEWRWIEAIISEQLHNPAIKAVVVSSRDITEQVKSRQELEKLSLVASGTDNGVVITDASGLTEWVNEGFTKMTGYTLSEMLGKRPGDFLRGEETDEAAIRLMDENLKRGIHFNVMLVNYRKSGNKYWVSMDITPIHNSSGTITHFIAIQKDITFRKEAEAKLLKMTHDLYTQNTDLQQFTYIISHNLRAPVANALGLTNLLSSTEKTSVVFDTSLEYLKQTVEQIDTVLKDVYTVLSIRDKQTVLEKELLLLGDVVWEAYHHLREPLLLHNASFEVDLPEGLTLSANRAYLFSVLSSLLSNAIKYRSNERPLKVKVSYMSSNTGSHIITLSDNGLGFNTEKAGDKVFKLYKTFHRQSRGRGFGLFLAKTQMEAMGGNIEVTSEENTGTEFKIYLPE